MMFKTVFVIGLDLAFDKGHMWVLVPRSYVVAWLVDIIPHVDAYKYKGHTYRSDTTR